MSTSTADTGLFHWVLEHPVGGRTSLWHYYIDGDYKPAACGHAPIPGTPMVFDGRPGNTLPKTSSALSSCCRECVSVLYYGRKANTKYVQIDADLTHGHGPFVPPRPKAEPSYPRPIPVSERLPEDGVICLVFGRCDSIDAQNYAIGGEWQIAAYNWNEQSGFEVDLGEPFTVTHWLPLPPAPTEGT